MSKRTNNDGATAKIEPEKKTLKREVGGDLEHLYDQVDTSQKSRRLLAELNITDVESLVVKAAELKRADLPEVNKGTQKQLHTFCLWYNDFYMKNEAGTDWKLHFVEESLSNFEIERHKSAQESSNTNGELLEKDLEYVCEEIEVSNRTQRQLAKLGITNVEALLAKKVELELFSLEDIKKTVQKNFLKFCL